MLLRRARAMHVEARLSFVGELVLSHASAGCEVHISSVISSVLRVGPGLRQGCHRLVLCATGGLRRFVDPCRRDLLVRYRRAYE